MECIAYKGGYKYQLDEEYSIPTDITPEEDINIDFIHLETDGQITLTKGYAWDGATMAPDSPSIMRGSLVHDAFYQLMRLEKLNQDVFRKTSDQLLKAMCEEDGMHSAAAWTVYYAVRALGGSAASRENVNPVVKAPATCQ